MLPIPDSGKPLSEPELGVAVQFKTVPGTVDDREIMAVPPEQIFGVVELTWTSGKGSTVTI